MLFRASSGINHPGDDRFFKNPLRGACGSNCRPRPQGPLPYARYSVSQIRRPPTAVAGQERRRDAVVVFRVSFQEGVHTPTTVRYAARATNDAMNNPTNSERSPRVVPPPIHSAHCIELVWLDGKATGFLPIAQQEASPRQESVAQNGPKR